MVGIQKKNIRIVEQVLKDCLTHGLAVNLEKSEFHQKEVNISGHVINGTEIQMQYKKVNTILEWQPPTKKNSFRPFGGSQKLFCQSYTFHQIDQN